MSDDRPFPKRLPPLPDLEWREDGVPRALDSDDVYFSVSDGLSETREVFFRGCGLPERWAGREDFTVGELGFGTGLNVAALLMLWKQHKPSATARLYIASFEGRLMPKAAAGQALAAWPELSIETQALLEGWPVRARGVQSMDLGDGVRLTLYQDDIGSAIKNAQFNADAWFLDGFSPAKNPDMWTDEVLAHVGRLSAPGALVGTYTVAGHVRRGLAAAGFDVSKQPGFGRKRERLEAIYRSNSEPSKRAAKSVVIVGAGIMGACLAQAFKAVGIRPIVLDQAEDLTQGASANPLGLVMPRLDATDTPIARLLLDAYLYARRFYAQLEEGCYPVDVHQPAKDDKDHRRFGKLLSDPPLDEALLSGNEEWLLHKGGLILDPVIARKALLEGMDVRWRTRVSQIEPGSPCHLTLSTGETLEADLVILASGMGVSKLVGNADLTGRAGQLEYGFVRSGDLRAVAAGHYAIQADGRMVFGATFEPAPDEGAPEITDQARQSNLEGFKGLDSTWAEAVDVSDFKSRTGVRATTPDRLPSFGPVVDEVAFKGAFGEDLRTGRPVNLGALPLKEGVWVASGLGSRGLTWAPLLAACCVSYVNNAPLPTGATGLSLLRPERFLQRRLTRGAES